jgi:hypothetical protein
MWDPCCTPAPNVADCMYVYSLPVFTCVFASHVTFSFESLILALFSSLTMTLPKKRVRTLHDRLKIIQEVEKILGRNVWKLQNDSGCSLAH